MLHVICISMPSTDIFYDDNYYLWKSNTDMGLAQNELPDNITKLPDCTMVA